MNLDVLIDDRLMEVAAVSRRKTHFLRPISPANPVYPEEQPGWAEAKGTEEHDGWIMIGDSRTNSAGKQR
jgi:hypothetical protein